MKLACALLLSLAAAAAAADFPSKPVRIVVPYPPAGSVDFVARAMQPRLQEIWRQPVIVENKAGASGVIGSDFVAKAEPDGYTLLLGGTQTHAMNVGVVKAMPYDPVRDFTPITQTTRANWVLAAHPSLGVRSPQELIAVIKQQPGKLAYASSGTGSAAHLAFAMLEAQLGLDLIHVPYKGIGPGVADTVAGRVGLIMGDQSTLVPHIRGGRLVAIAMTGNARSALMPELPTIADTVAPGFDVQAWQGIWAPPRMKDDLAREINQAMVRALRDPQVAERLTNAGVEPVGSPVESFAAFTRAEVTRWTAAARSARIQPE
jgi:tripartite-type tricarboxylate transporter receptor subunit TctC